MTETLARLDEPGDAELISAVRGGDVSAYGLLFERHADSARRLARQIAGHSDADDLVSDAFTKVLRVLQNGGGPDLAFRAYLLTAVRRLHVDKIRSGSKLQSSDNMESFDAGVPFRDTAVEGFESAAAAQAFSTLPERWQAVLWHTEVEGQKPAEVAQLLGMTPNSVSALAYRAREGLRQAFLNSHIADRDTDDCAWTHEHLGAYIRNGVSKRDATKVEKHLDECRKCMAIYLELTEVNSNLGGILAPLLLGAAGSTYLASAAGLAGKGGILLLLDRAKDAIVANSQAAAVAGVAAAAVVVGGTVVVVTGDDGSHQADAPAVVSPTHPNAKPSHKPTKSHSPRPSHTSPPVASPPVFTTSPAAPTSAPSPSAAPTGGEPNTAPPTQGNPPPTSPPTTSPPTTSPPTNPPPTSDLALAPLRVTHRGNLFYLSIDSSGYPPGGTAVVDIAWRNLTLHKMPTACKVTSRVSVRCSLSAEAPRRTGIQFNAKGIRLLPAIRATATPTNFTDGDSSNNTSSWRMLVSLLFILQL